VRELFVSYRRMLFAVLAMLGLALSVIAGRAVLQWLEYGNLRVGDCVNGVVVSSSVRVVSNVKRSIYVPNVRYRYTVAGQEYYGNRISVISGGYCRYDDALEISRRFPPGATVVIRYDRNSPNNSFAEISEKEVKGEQDENTL